MRMQVQLDSTLPSVGGVFPCKNLRESRAQVANVLGSTFGFNHRVGVSAAWLADCDK